MNPVAPPDTPEPPAGQVALPPAALAALGLSAPVFVDRGGVTRVPVGEGVVWAKTVEPVRRGINGLILPVIAMLTPSPILRRGQEGKGGDTLLHQAARLRELGGQGLPVAKLLYGDRDVLITADGGGTIEKVVRHADRRDAAGQDDAALREALLLMTRALGALHTAGTAHGRPKIRDFAWDGARVTILDLEERPWEVMPMADAQARDVFLWIHDLCSAPFSRDLAPEAAALLSADMEDGTRDSLRRFLRLLRYAGPPARGMLRLLPGNRELTAGLAAHDVLRGIVA